MLESLITDWLHLLARWLHIIFGAAWIGASFYFNWLNNNVREPDGPADPGVGGEVWSVHGGAFYRVLKYRVAPERLPETLHWFKFEAYLTWVSGICLLALVYYFGAEGFMVDPQVADISHWTAVGIGVGALVASWLVYDLLCKSPLVDHSVAFFFVIFGLMTAAAFGLSQTLSARAAYIHVGAMIGTMMAANVFFVIIPGQRDMVDAMIAGREPPAHRGKAGALRSLHNNYFTLPVLFIMVSNHFPFTFGHQASWLILAVLSMTGAGVRHWFNLHGRGERNVWILPTATVAMIALALVSAPPGTLRSHGGGGVQDTGPPVVFNKVQSILTARCVPCHSRQPSQPGFLAPPKNLVFENPQQIQAAAGLIHAQTVTARIMPLGNLTQMTEDERALIGRWFRQGAKVE